MGALSFRANAQVNARIIVVYAPEEDIEVKITMGGAAGQTHTVRDDRGPPGERNGISVFKTTLRNHEYLIKLGVHEGQGGGPRGGIAAFNSGCCCCCHLWWWLLLLLLLYTFITKQN